MERSFTVSEWRTHRIVVPDAPDDEQEWEDLKEEMLDDESWRDWSVEDSFEEVQVQ